MTISLKEARRIIQEHGAQYGWHYDKETGLQFSPTKSGLSYTQAKWKVIDEASIDSDDVAKKVLKAVSREGKYELRLAQRRIQRRKRTDVLLRPYEQKALEIVQKQRKRLLETREEKETQLNLQNIYQETTSNAYRQTPLQRTSITGLEQKRVRTLEQLKKAASSRNFFSRTTYSSEITEKLQDFLYEIGLDIDFEKLWEKEVQQFGDPYKAFEHAFMEINEIIKEQRNRQSEWGEAFSEIVESGEYDDLLEELGLLDIPIDGF